MRVISGIYKGRKILSPENNGVRPTTDKVKEAIFGMLQSVICDAVVIDLFAGTGGLGIEALSRGAKKVYFCDGASSSIELIKKNISFLKEGSFEILRGDYSDCLKRLKSKGVQAEIILCDPPYSKGLPAKVAEEIVKNDILSKNGVFIVERKTSDKAQTKFFAYRSGRSYGDTSIDYYLNVTKCAVTGTFDPFTKGHKYIVEKALEKFDFCHIAILCNEAKSTKYSIETRKKMILISTLEYKNRIKIDYYQGMAVDYCRENGIQYIYRGYRNEKDEKYEKEMAEYNYIHGKVETVLIKSENDISSTFVKEEFEQGKEIAEYVSDGVKGLMKRR